MKLEFQFIYLFLLCTRRLIFNNLNYDLWYAKTVLSYFNTKTQDMILKTLGPLPVCKTKKDFINYFDHKRRRGGHRASLEV